MKKIISGLVMSVVLAGSVFAMDLNIGLKGLAGAVNSGENGTSVGGGLDINLDIKNGFGIQVESNIAPSAIKNEKEGITFTDKMLVNIPAMAWYNARFSWFGLGLGAGFSCTMSENHPENVSNTKLGLAAGLKTKFFVNDNISIVAGVTGNLDCFPNLQITSNGDSRTYKFIKSDFSRNSIFASIGLEYRIAL